MVTTEAPRESFIDRMVEKTLGRTDVQPKRGQNYNYPLRCLGFGSRNDSATS